MAEKPADAVTHATSIWVRGAPFLHVQWPEIEDYQPVSNAALLAQCDDWIRRAAEREIHVVTHSALVVNRLRRRVAEGVLPADALRALYLRDGEVTEIPFDSAGVALLSPAGWCDADCDEAHAIFRARQERDFGPADRPFGPFWPWKTT